MRVKPNHLPDPRDAGLYVRYVEICRRAGVDPVSPNGVRNLVAKWNAALRGEIEQPDAADERSDPLTRVDP